MIRRVLLVLMCLTIGACSRTTDTGPSGTGLREVIIDHDGGVDDLVAIALLMKSSAIHIRAISICPADSYLDDATRSTRLVVDRLGGEKITIAQGHSEGTHPFPDEWRKSAGNVLSIPSFAGVEPTAKNPVVADAAHYLATLLSGKQKFEILETGPLTNIADLLKLNPAFKDHISRIYIMGGAVRAHGNVVLTGFDGAAEWNIFNQPEAADAVIRSGIPITLIPLDATNKVPLTREFVDRLAAQPSVASQIAAQAWKQAIPPEGQDPYYFWDTLTAAAMIDPGVVTTQSLRMRVVTTGPSEGRTIENINGTYIDVAMDANRERVEKLFLDVLNR